MLVHAYRSLWDADRRSYHKTSFLLSFAFLVDCDDCPLVLFLLPPYVPESSVELTEDSDEMSECC